MKKTWKNTTLDISLTIEYDPLWVSSFQYTVCYPCRDKDLKKVNLFGAHFIDDKGSDILIINGQSLLHPVSNIYVTPVGCIPAQAILPSNQNIQGSMY